MNDVRRRTLRGAVELLEQAKGIIEDCAQEERSCFERKPESLQYCESGEKMEENADNMDDAVSNLQDVIDGLEEVIDN